MLRGKGKIDSWYNPQPSSRSALKTVPNFKRLPASATRHSCARTPIDGRFLIVKPAAKRADGMINILVVLNWFEELKRLVPTG